MDFKDPIRILLVEDNPEFANLVQLFLKRYDKGSFQVIWKESGKSALEELRKALGFDVILMDYFLPGQNGLEVTKAIQEKGYPIPVVFLTVNKDFDLAVEVMKLGVEDYLVKEEITTPVLPKAILNAIERRKLRDELTELEVSQKRLEAIQMMVEQIATRLREPLATVREKTEDLLNIHQADWVTSYLMVIRENLERIEKKIAQLKKLKSDKTVTYVQDVRMFDLSE